VSTARLRITDRARRRSGAGACRTWPDHPGARRTREPHFAYRREAQAAEHGLALGKLPASTRAIAVARGFVAAPASALNLSSSTREMVAGSRWPECTSTSTAACSAKIRDPGRGRAHRVTNLAGLYQVMPPRSGRRRSRSVSKARRRHRPGSDHVGRGLAVRAEDREEPVPIPLEPGDVAPRLPGAAGADRRDGNRSTPRIELHGRRAVTAWYTRRTPRWTTKLTYPPTSLKP